MLYMGRKSVPATYSKIKALKLYALWDVNYLPANTASLSKRRKAFELIILRHSGTQINKDNPQHTLRSEA